MSRLRKSVFVCGAASVALLSMGVVPASAAATGTPTQSRVEAGYLVSATTVEASANLDIPVLNCNPEMTSEVVLGLGEERGSGHSVLGGGADIGCDDGSPFYLVDAGVEPQHGGGEDNFDSASAGDHIVVQLTVSGGAVTVTTHDVTEGFVETATDSIAPITALVEGAVTPGAQSYLGYLDKVVPLPDFGAVEIDSPMIDHAALEAAAPSAVEESADRNQVTPGPLGQNFRLTYRMT